MQRRGCPVGEHAHRVLQFPQQYRTRRTRKSHVHATEKVVAGMDPRTEKFQQELKETEVTTRTKSTPRFHGIEVSTSTNFNDQPIIQLRTPLCPLSVQLRHKNKPSTHLPHLSLTFLSVSLSSFPLRFSRQLYTTATVQLDQARDWDVMCGCGITTVR